MFEIRHIKNKGNISNYIEVTHNDGLYTKIDLNLGGSLQELVLKNKTIISSKESLPYEESYASAILFPFANRIENGVYMFDDTSYQLNINKTEENNAIHGLVYNKTFDVVHYASYKNDAVVHVRYIEKGYTLGFPFKYAITLTYAITLESVELIVEIKNMDTSSFPFTIGWHPYFVSSNLHQSVLSLNTKKKLLVNEQLIPIGEESIDVPNEYQIKNLKLDDCFILNNNQLCFKTPDYKMDFSFSSDENYIQLYIPPNRKTIAIEPQTGSANNFNNHRGLKILHPTQIYEERWKINIL